MRLNHMLIGSEPTEMNPPVGTANTGSSTPQCPPGSNLRGQDVAKNRLGLLLVQCAILRMSTLPDFRWLKAQDLLRVSGGHT